MPDRAPLRLEVSDLSRSFGGRRVVDQVSLSVAAGQVTCLLGPSGCGKSTTLRMIAGVERADAGEVRLDGVTVAGPGVNVPPEVRSVGLMFQDFALFPHLTVAENVGFGLRIDRAEKARRVDALLEKVDLTGFGPKHPPELSGGGQEGVARAGRGRLPLTRSDRAAPQPGPRRGRAHPVDDLAAVGLRPTSPSSPRRWRRRGWPGPFPCPAGVRRARR